jgi:anti-sigma-K factor RskA
MMSEAGLDHPEPSADEALALDYALGILVEPDLGHARKRLREDAEFANLVLICSERLEAGAPDSDDGGTLPRSGTWNAIRARILKAERS